MKRTGRTVKLSSLFPNRYSLPPRGWNPTIVCEDCNTHCQVRHGLVEIHRPGGTRCAGSGVKVVFDVTADEWDLALRKAVRATEGPLPACFIGGEVRRSNRVMLKPEPQTASPLHRLAAAR